MAEALEGRPAASASFDRMWADLAPVGQHAATGGYRRYVWSAAEQKCREWFVGEAERRSLDVDVDGNGNIWAWWGNPDVEGPGVVIGSHLDSVPDGGAFDGPLGVVSAFAALDSLRDSHRSLRRPVAVVAFADEEGARFGIACAGSRLLTGQLSKERALGLTDDDGDSMAEVLRRAGRDPQALGQDDRTLARIGRFVELHIEQGRHLVNGSQPVGIGSSIWPHGRWRMEFDGRADHAGTTRLEDRRDPMLPFAQAVIQTRQAAIEGAALATVGKVRVEPNGTNAIPSRVTAWLDVRSGDEAGVRAVVEQISDHSEAEVHEESWSPRVDLRGDLTGQLSATLPDAPLMESGAGHDAGILATAGVPSAMLFVRNPTGVSHSPSEHAEEEDCQAGVSALSAVVAHLVSG